MHWLRKLLSWRKPLILGIHRMKLGDGEVLLRLRGPGTFDVSVRGEGRASLTWPETGCCEMLTVTLGYGGQIGGPGTIAATEGDAADE